MRSVRRSRSTLPLEVLRAHGARLEIPWIRRGTPPRLCWSSTRTCARPRRPSRRSIWTSPEVSPLTRKMPSEPRLAEVGSGGLGPLAGHRLHRVDRPARSTRQMVAQSLLAAAGDVEAMEVDGDFLRALGTACRLPADRAWGVGTRHHDADRTGHPATRCCSRWSSLTERWVGRFAKVRGSAVRSGLQRRRRRILRFRGFVSVLLIGRSIRVARVVHRACCAGRVCHGAGS